MKEKILVVGDEGIDRFMLEWGLIRAGYDVVLAGNEEEFWERTFDMNISLIIFDLCFKNRFGRDIYQSLLGFGIDRKVPIIFTTEPESEHEMNSKSKILEAGGFIFLTKPVDLEEIYHEVERRIAGRQASQGLLELK